ncbi:MAG: PilZ domain-containing protein [Pyrinomonadaceae bacterium]
MSDERRNYRRVPVLVEVYWEGKTGRYEARTSDLSSGGCFIDTVGQVTEGERLKFQLQLPNGEWMEAEGEVTYAYSNIGFGVRFTEALSESDRKKIDWIVKAEAHRLDGKQ